MNNDLETMVLVSIVKPDMGVKLIKTLKERDICLHFQCVGFGTAPTEMMDIFGLGTNNKDLVISIGSKRIIEDLMSDFSSDFNTQNKYGGLMIVLRMYAVNRLVAEILNHNVSSNGKGEESMKNEHHNNLIMISVNNGYSDVVMETAKKAGATGGTIIKGRLADSEQLVELGQKFIDEEREIICILAPEQVSNAIMEQVNAQFGFFSEANGIFCAVPTEKAYKI